MKSVLFFFISFSALAQNSASLNLMAYVPYSFNVELNHQNKQVSSNLSDLIKTNINHTSYNFSKHKYDQSIIVTITIN